MKIELKKCLPFTGHDGKRGTVTEGYYCQMWMETAESKAGLSPFRISEYENGKEYRRREFMDVCDAATKFTEVVQSMRKDLHGLAA